MNSADMNSYAAIGTILHPVTGDRPANAMVQVQDIKLWCRIVGSHGTTAEAGARVSLKGRLTMRPSGICVEVSQLRMLHRNPATIPADQPFEQTLVEVQMEQLREVSA